MDDRLRHLQARALSHPVRVRILELHHRDRGRSLTAESLAAQLATTPGFESMNAARVSYHRARLQDAELLPV